MFPIVVNQKLDGDILYPPYLTRLGALVAIGCLVAMIVGGIDGFIDLLNPLPLLSIVPLVICAGISGILVGLSGRYFVLPGGRVYLFVGLLSAVSFVYAKWAVWASYFKRALTLKPMSVFNSMSAFATTVDRLLFDAIVLWSLWIFEASVGISVIALSAWAYGLSRFEYTQMVSQMEQ